MSQFERHLFICTSGRACPHQGASEILAELRQAAKSAGITDRIRVNKAGCLAQCGYGPMVVVYPEGVWYAALRPGDGARIVAEHLVGGTPVEELRYHPQGPGIQICEPGSEPIPPTPVEDRGA